MVMLSPILWRKLAILSACVPLFLIMFYIGRNSAFLLSEFVFISDNIKELEKCNNIDKLIAERIPPVIHQIHGFKDSTMKESHVNKIKAWKRMHTNYTTILWNATSATDLIEREYKHLYTLFKSYGSWIQRADVARYVILHRYGGWYIDLDVRCESGLHEIAERAYHQKKRVVHHTTFPWGISNDIFGITPRHPYLKFVLSNLHNSNRWYIIPHWNVLFSAGSTYMWGRYLNYPCKDDFLILDKGEFEKYFKIEHDGSWHSWDDTVVIALAGVFRNPVKFTIVMVFLFVILSVYLGVRLSATMNKKYFRQENGV